VGLRARRGGLDGAPSCGDYPCCLREAPPPTPRCRREEAGASPAKGTRRAPCRRTEGTAMMSAWGEKEAAPMQRRRGRPRVRGGPPGAARASDRAPAWASWAIRASCSGELWSTPRGAFPSFRAKREKRGPSRRTASWRRPSTRRAYASGGPDGRMRTWRSPRESARACSCLTWTQVKARTRWPCSNSPVASPRRPRALQRVGEGCIYISDTLPYKN
jgi:hypothetical protein